jgi:hypothetical protein
MGCTLAARRFDLERLELTGEPIVNGGSRCQTVHIIDQEKTTGRLAAGRKPAASAGTQTAKA